MHPDRTPPRPQSFAEALARQDAARFVGRAEELRELERIASLGGATVAFVHGPPGVGKSALVRAFARRLAARDDLVEVVDDLPATLSAGAALRAELLERGHAGLVVVASRRVPDPGWSQDGWESVVRPLELGPLTSEDATALLGLLGVKPAHVDEIRRFACGHPLALVLGATRRSLSPNGPPLVSDPQLATMILERLLDEEEDRIDPEALRVASLLPMVDERVLTAVAPSVVAETSMAALRSLSVATHSDGRVSVHDRVRAAAIVRLRHADPARERDLRRKLGDHLEERVTAGDATWLAPFAELFRDPELRRMFASDARRRHRPAPPRPGDAERAAAALGVTGATWWNGVARWFADAPEAVTTVRDDWDRLTGFCILITLASAPAWVNEDVVLASRLQHARTRYPAGDVVIWRDAFGFPTDDEDPAGPLITAIHSAIARSGRLDALCTYGTVMVGEPVTESLAQGYGAVPVPELEVTDGDRVVTCHVLHHGFGGYAGAARALLYAELGLAPPRQSPAALRSAVRAALRAWHDPVVLSGNPLATGGPVTERAASVRRLLERAVAQAFGATPRERMLRDVLEAAHLHPIGTHDEAARRLHLSRSTYFRHLAMAVDHLVAVLELELERESGSAEP